jgi:hypothetical protein
LLDSVTGAGHDEGEGAYVVNFTKEQLQAAPAGSIEELTRDDGLVSSRKPQDIPAFNREMLALFDRERAGAA